MEVAETLHPPAQAEGNGAKRRSHTGRKEGSAVKNAWNAKFFDGMLRRVATQKIFTAETRGVHRDFFTAKHTKSTNCDIFSPRGRGGERKRGNRAKPLNRWNASDDLNGLNDLNASSIRTLPYR